MVHYHYYPTLEAAKAALETHRAAGGLGYYMGMIGNEYEVRTIHGSIAN